MKKFFCCICFLLPLFAGGCSSTLTRVERETSLGRIETAKGWQHEGSISARQERLAEQEIKDREVSFDTLKGYKILVVNISNDPIKIQIRKYSFWWSNPLVAEFNFYGKGSKEGYLMPGKYEVSTNFGHKVYEVTTAPCWDEEQQEYYHCVIRNRKISRCEYRNKHNFYNSY
jgi:hypothetical protein